MKSDSTLPPLAHCKILEWDSRFFNLNIARLQNVRVGDAEMAQAMQWCRDESVDCLYFLAQSNDDQSVAQAEQNGFHLVDIRATYQQSLADRERSQREPNFRCYAPGDLPFLQEIAQQSYTDSRFYYDAHFPRARVDELYRIWVEKSCSNHPQGVLVTEHNGQPAGFVTCEVDERNVGKIGLVGVDKEAQGFGLGGNLVRSALDWFAHNKATSVEVVTQGRNLKAQRLYAKFGFLPSQVELWYHKWFGL